MIRKIVPAIAATAIALCMATAPAFAAAASVLQPATVSQSFAAKSTAAKINDCVQKFKTTATKYYSDYGFSTNHYTYTAAELKMVAAVIYSEAKNEPYATKIAVGNVVMNRVLAPGYPGSTIKEVVTRPNQFSYNENTQPNAECIKAATDVLKYEMWAVPQNTYYFRSSSSTANWGSHSFYKRIGNTAFYCDSYSGRSNTSAVPDKLFQRVYKWPQYGCVVSRNVRKVQTMLNSLGYKTSCDGWFGQGTKDAMIKFQKKNGLTADGVAGPTTLKKLITKYGLNKFLKLK